jgi:hypothetical protein
LESFWATEEALSLATLTNNLTVLFQRHLGGQTKSRIAPAKMMMKFAVPLRERDERSRAGEKILCAFPQLQCSRKAPLFYPLIPTENQLPLHRPGGGFR